MKIADARDENFIATRRVGAYKIIGVRKFKTPTGFPVKLLVAQGFQFYGPQ